MTFGLIGKSLKHSFSKDYFTKKFAEEGIDARYENFELESVDELKPLLKKHLNIRGLNVTIPFKEDVINLMDDLSPEAVQINAVNTILIDGGKLIGHNTDAYGFSMSIKPFLKHGMDKALILGTGGASKAVAYALRKIGLEVFFASRNPNSGRNEIGYKDLNLFAVQQFKLIVNSTPLGTWPDIDEKPDIPYDGIGENHLLYDLVYNPEQTTFLKEGNARGAQTLNGLSMLRLQAEKSWEIWNSEA
jgi:shikimate dehydrogenase